MSHEDKFIIYTGDTGNLCTNENHICFMYNSDQFNILFSVARRGNAASIHFSSDKAGLKSLKRVINEFIDFVFNVFPWCNMVIGQITKPSVCRLAVKCGFTLFATSNKFKFYMRMM